MCHRRSSLSTNNKGGKKKSKCKGSVHFFYFSNNQLLENTVGRSNIKNKHYFINIINTQKKLIYIIKPYANEFYSQLDNTLKLLFIASKLYR